MATKTMQLDIVSAEKSIYSGLADFVAVTGGMGELGIVPGHLPLITYLKPGHLQARFENEEKYFYLSGGILEVQPEVVTVMADTVVRAEDIDEESAKQARARIEEAMRNKELDPRKAAMQLAEANAQLRVLQELRHLHRHHKK